MLVFVMIGGVLLFFGIKTGIKRKLLQKNGKKATGIIIDNELSEFGESVLYYTIVEVEDTKNNKRKFKLSTATNIAREVGKPIDIVYDPNYEKSEVFENRKVASASEIILKVVGVFFIVIGLIDSKSIFHNLILKHVLN
ncbi:DUF3592 domain-containing protein [Tenacibaculum sp. C7A-26P2]|uniref:DUF3592 domain-containing protein n=1 Tax=Tenacibaculum sp. C7A-26P2 TaxID=3447504 RepID=UPI003F867B34